MKRRGCKNSRTMGRYHSDDLYTVVRPISTGSKVVKIEGKLFKVMVYESIEEAAARVRAAQENQGGGQE